MIICSLNGATLCAQVIWDGGGGNNLWSDPLNWDVDALPGISDDVTIGSSATVLIQVGESFELKSLTLSDATLTIDPGGQLSIETGSTYAFTLDNGTFVNDGILNIANCTNGIRLMGTTSSFENNNTVTVDNHNGYGLLFNSGCTSCMVNNDGSFYFDNGLASTNPTIFYQVSGNHFNNSGLLDIGATANAGIGIGLGNIAAGALNNSGTINITNTGAGRAGISVGFLGGSLVNNMGASINLGAGIGGTWAGGFNMALTNDGTININKVGTVSVNAMGTGSYGGSQAFDNSNNVSPGSSIIGCLSFNAGYVNTVSSPVPVTSIQLGGTSACTDHDKINVTGGATLAGTLTITLANGFSPSPGQSFTILEADNITGTYSTVNYPTVSGISWTISYNSTAVTVSAVSSFPVELVEFKATPLNGESVLLAWQTASEKDNAGFEVERSSDGRSWENIGFVNGQGNSVEPVFYQIKDVPEAINGQLYYRLRQIDHNGHFDFSQVVSIIWNKLQNEGKFTVSPNPTSGPFTLQGNFPTGSQCLVYDAWGRIVLIEELSEGQDFSISLLPKGVYTVAIFKDKTLATSRLFKQS